MSALSGSGSGPKRKRTGFLGCLGRGVRALLVILVIGLAAGAVYQAAASASDAKRYPPPGKMYDVGVYRLHLYCMGEGSPTVILEAGAGSPALGWYPVQHEAARFTRVCSYDRAGFGWSDPAPTSLSREQVAEALHRLLGAASLPGPYIMVGHSAGGEYIRAYAQQYPAEVAGMVLVDSSHESQSIRYPAKFTSFTRNQQATVRLCQLLEPVGIIRVSRLFDGPVPISLRSSQLGQAAMSTMYRTGYCKAAYEEEAVLLSPGRVGGPGSLGDIPLIVLSAGDMYGGLPDAVVSAIGGPEGVVEVARVHDELQQQLVQLSTRGRQVIAEKSGHQILWDQPELVIIAIRQIMDEVKAE